MDAADLAFAGTARQAEMVRAGEVSSRELVETYLERIERLDPQLNAFRVVLSERALAEADEVDANRSDDAEAADRPLHGVPLAIKDDTDVAGEVTAFGTSAYGPAPAQDAELVRRLRAAGAIVIGKTNVPELTMFPFTESKTWGTTRNPWDLERTPGGSSGGTGAGVAAGLIGASQGSDGAGSIRIPSAWCGLFGIKPQRDRLPIHPHVDAWQGMTVVGPLARSVRDAALFLDAAAGPFDGTGPALPERSFSDAATQPPGALRIAVSYKLPPGVVTKLDSRQRRATEQTVELLRSLGHTVDEHDPEYGTGVLLNVIPRYLRGIHDDAVAMPRPDRLERRTRGMSRLGGMISPATIARVRAAEAAFRARLERVFEDHDVLMTPATAAVLPRAEMFEGRGALWTLNGVAAQVPYNGVWNATGNPAAAVPAGFTSEGHPLSVQLVGRTNDEATLLSLAAQIEAERPWADRRPPIS